MQEHLRAIALRFLKRAAPVYKVAFHLGIDPEELRNLEIWESLYQQAISGRNTPATIFWLKTRAGAGAKSSKPTPDEYEYPDPPIIQIIDELGNVCK